MVYQNRKSLIVLFWVFLFGFVFQDANAWTGKLKPFFDSDSEAQNWAVPKYPKIVIALGFLQPEFVGNYASLSFEYFSKSRPDLEISVLLFAKNHEIVAELQDPKTVGIVFISHNFKTQIETASMMDASLAPIPSDILSAATPALRFAAFIGCHGPGLKRHYQVEYEMNRLPGAQRVYTPESSFVTAKDILFFIESGVEEALRQVAQEIETLDFLQGELPAPDRFGVLSVFAKDIVPGIEPRFVLVNGKIVGMLGVPGMSGEEYLPQSFQRYFFAVPSEAIFLDHPTQRIVIRSAELTPTAPADDYLISEVELRWPHERKTWRGTYDPPLHLGDDEVPYTGEPASMPQTLKTEADIWQLQKYLKDIEWIDRDATHWPKKYQRFFSKPIDQVQ